MLVGGVYGSRALILPAWLEPLFDAEIMRRTDAWAIEHRGIPAAELMERAGQKLARAVVDLAPVGPVAILCGRGNNGGDGLVVGRLLRDKGREVDIWLTSEPAELSPDAQAQLSRLPRPAAKLFSSDESAASLAKATVVVDALLGTGFSGAPRGAVASAIQAINDAERLVVAADVPSGVDATTGEVDGVAVRATVTVSFHRGKLGLWIAPGKTHAGSVTVADIGIPPHAPFEASAGLISDAVVLELPHRGAASTKFSSGRVVVVGGSTGLTGAPTMAALGAQRAGAGYVTVAAPASLESNFAARLLEAMFAALPGTNGHLGPDALPLALERCRNAGAVVLGPGLGRERDAARVARRLARELQGPLVVDADGLNALNGRLARVLSERSHPTVLTPHTGELARLLEITSSEVDRRRLHSARCAADEAKAIVVLKGDDTVVATPDNGFVAVSPGSAPGLATAGTGDVLAGVIAALLARGLPPDVAACAGVHLHLRAGQLAADPHGPNAVIASDVIAALPAAQSLESSL